MSRLIDLCKNSLKINQMKDSTAVIKPNTDTIPKPTVIKPNTDTIPKPAVIKPNTDTIPKPSVIKQKLEVKVNADVLMKVTKYNTPNILLELLNKDNKSDDNMNYYMSPEYKIQLIEEWINKNKDKWYNTGITTSDIKDIKMKYRKKAKIYKE